MSRENYRYFQSAMTTSCFTALLTRHAEYVKAGVPKSERVGLLPLARKCRTLLLHIKGDFSQFGYERRQAMLDAYFLLTHVYGVEENTAWCGMVEESLTKLQ